MAGTAKESEAPEIAYCGLVCSPVCSHAPEGCPGCRAGGGPESCRKRECCLERRVEGCWECDGFPCAEGFSDDEAWRGLTTGCVQMVSEMGAPAYAELVIARLGAGYDYGYMRYRTPEGVKAILRGEEEIPREDPDLRRQG